MYCDMVENCQHLGLLQPEFKIISVSDQGLKEEPCSVHCTAVSRRWTADESYSHVVCTADFWLKNTRRNIQNIILEYIINFRLHNFEATFLRQCLVVSFFSLGFTEFLQRCVCFFRLGLFGPWIFCCSFWEWFTLDFFCFVNYPEQSVYRQTLHVSFFFQLFQSYELRNFLFFFMWIT